MTQNPGQEPATKSAKIVTQYATNIAYCNAIETAASRNALFDAPLAGALFLLD